MRQQMHLHGALR